MFIDDESMMYWGGESQGDFTKKVLSLTINMVAAQELLGPRSRDAGISGVHDFQKTRFFPKPKGCV